MLKFVSWIFFIVVALVICALSIANRHDVMFSLDPLPFVFDLPLFLLLLAAGFVGLIIGSFVTWRRGSKVRTENRQNRRENADLKGQNTKLTQDIAETKAASQNNMSPTSAQSPRLEHQQ
ncbi:lipopolysaccharide assembly protein LapA domain-containing protein [Sneathiella marina]|uniref:Lipopolysaccharide assembly protein LapA domain-containing protein n=1 Tax=Sneathiella marina TaxID=2950108 RepID=A0ABY4W6U0_9PROT|nr:lipopolysaccharide assembly protein LapA domain-containing protein [Sneathiella marina]USG61450.1 lipopolysaccharide assembly protein LapA domain-containing protein [Sneathiella marina]